MGGTLSDKTTGHVGTLFLDDGVETWEKWIKKMTPWFKTDPLDVKNHSDIAQLYGVYDDFNKHEKNNMNCRTRFLTLLLEIQSKKRELSRKEYQEGECIPLNVSVSFMEGNNRMAAMVNAMFASAYDVAEGITKPNSLNIEWLVDKVSNTDLEKKTINHTLNEAEGDIIQWTDEAMKDSQSMYRKLTKLWIYSGKSKQTILEQHITRDMVQQAAIANSKNISDDKRKSSMTPDSQHLAESLTTYVNQLVNSATHIAPGHFPTFGREFAGAEYYQENDPKRSPDDDGAVFTSETFQELLYNPSEQTLRRAAEELKSGIATRLYSKGRKYVRVTGKEGYGPFWITDDSIIHLIGEWRVAESKPKPITTGGVATPKKHRNTPLGIEEWNISLLMCMVFPIIFRMHHKIPLEGWDTHIKRHDCAKELEFLLRTQLNTNTADSWGKKLETRKWKHHCHWNYKEDTPLSPNRRYWAASIMLSGMIVAMMYIPPNPAFDPAYDPAHSAGNTAKTAAKLYKIACRKTMTARKKAKARIDLFITAIAGYTNDTAAKDIPQNDSELVDILGKQGLDVIA